MKDSEKKIERCCFCASGKGRNEERNPELQRTVTPVSSRAGGDKSDISTNVQVSAKSTLKDSEKKVQDKLPVSETPKKNGGKWIVPVALIFGVGMLGVGGWLVYDLLSSQASIAVTDESDTEDASASPKEVTATDAPVIGPDSAVKEEKTTPAPVPEPTPEERYNNGADVPAEPIAAIAWYREFADKGVVDAVYRMGMCYYNTRSLPLNFEKAVELFRRAAEQGHTEAAVKLAECYEWGVGVDANPEEAAKWRPQGIPAPAPIGEPVVSASGDAHSPDSEATADAGYAPDSLQGKQIICSYAGAEISSHSTDDESPELPPFAPIQDNGKGAFDTEVGDIPMTRTLKVFSARTEDVAPALVKYTRTGENTAEVQIISLMIPDAEAALAVANVAAAIDSLTEEQIFEQIGQYALDSSDTLRLTFTGENTATAEGEFCAGTVENKLRGMKVQLVDGAADAVTPDAPDEEPAETVPSAEDVAPADLKGKTVVLDYTMSQYMYEEDGENVSGWQLYEAARKNKNHCADAFRALNLKPKATRNLLPITTPTQGGKYMYSRKSGCMGVIEVNTGMDASRVINIEFTSSSTGVATEIVEAGCFRGLIRNIQVTIK